MEPTRRAQYRVELDPSLGAQVVVELPDGKSHEGQLLDVTAAGAGVRVEGEAARALEVGQEVNLAFHGGPFSAPITVAAQVQHCTEERGGACRCGFRFLQPQQLDGSLPPALRSYFNRRKDVRVQPAADELISVVLSSDKGPSIEAWLVDLSLLGAGVALKTAVEPSFAASPAVNISIALPGTGQPVEMVGVIRNRRLVGGCIRYGMEFDPEATPGFTRHQDAIGRWMLGRQVAFLRRPA